LTPFAPILRQTVERVPGAIGAIFADWDGEAVEHVATGPSEDLLVTGAHYGVVLNYVQSALHLFHFGEAEEMIFLHSRIDLIVRTVRHGYYVVLAAHAGTHLAMARREVMAAASALAREMD
jgi:predicted regulator of Ras-like GTPase activity (Roadblock/LC7/MglB family)